MYHTFYLFYNLKPLFILYLKQKINWTMSIKDPPIHILNSK